jgi:hypothetical protein
VVLVVKKDTRSFLVFISGRHRFRQGQDCQIDTCGAGVSSRSLVSFKPLVCVNKYKHAKQS